MQKEYKVGDRVTWSSQAGGHSKQKTGVIVEVGQVGEFMTKMHRLASNRHRYIVEVETTHSRGSRKDLYLPSTSALRLVAAAKHESPPRDAATEAQEANEA